MLASFSGILQDVSMADTTSPQAAIDIICIPPAGYAAYWLSVKKLLDAKRGAQNLAAELSMAQEPYTRFLLETLASAASEETIRRMAHIKARTVSRDHRRKLRLMRTAACAVASGENPRKTLITLCGAFGMPVASEDKTMEQAQTLLESLRGGNLDLAVFPDVSHATRAEELILKLLFLQLLSRREGKASLLPFLPGISFPYLADALRLCIDNIDEPFIRRRLDSQAREMTLDAAHKMTMGLELALAIKNRRPYDEMLALAKAFLLDV